MSTLPPIFKPLRSYSYESLKERLDEISTLQELAILDNEIDDNYEAFKTGLDFDQKERFNELFSAKKMQLKEAEVKATNIQKYYQDKIDNLEFQRMRFAAIEDTTEAAYTYATKKEAGRQRRLLDKQIAELKLKQQRKEVI